MDSRNKGGDGTTPELHLLIKRGQFIDASQRLTDPAHRSEATLADPRTGYLPLYAALRIPTVPLSLVELLLDACPYERVVNAPGGDGARGTAPPSGRDDASNDRNGRVVNEEGSPLFVAVKYRLPSDVIFFLMSLSRAECFRKNSEEQLPLHVAPLASVDVVKALAGGGGGAAATRAAGDDGPEPASRADSDGMLPLHRFVREQSGQARIEVLLSAYPDALYRRDNRGMLPLHYAMKCNASRQLIQCFVAAHPDSVKIADGDGNLPVHCAFVDGSITRNLARKLEILLRVHPESASARNRDGLTPLALAERCRERWKVTSLDYNAETPVREILRASPRHRNDDGARRSAAEEDEYRIGPPPRRDLPSDGSKRPRIAAGTAPDSAAAAGGRPSPYRCTLGGCRR